jgi:F-type H+-transporting ATPase subunit a
VATSDKVDPIHQFHIVPLWENIGGTGFHFTNSALFMVLTVVVATLFFVWASAPRAIVPGRLQSVAELAYEFVAKMLKDSTGKEGMKFFPFVFSLFLFVLISNLFGMVPGFFTVGSQIIVTFALALLVILVVVLYGLYKHGLHFFGLFVPSGVPMLVVPLVTVIEVVSFLSRPVSLSVRLFANLLAGHITLKVFAGFVFSLGVLGPIGIVGAILPLLMTIGLTGLEFLVAFLQAYVFAVLTCMYLNDAVHPGH